MYRSIRMFHIFSLVLNLSLYMNQSKYIGIIGSLHVFVVGRLKLLFPRFTPDAQKTDVGQCWLDCLLLVFSSIGLYTHYYKDSY